jgi:acetoin utilization deacetylase AcuC-like enzyme
MATALYTHSVCTAHDMGPHHPESPDRLRAVLAALQAPGYAGLIRREAPLAAIEQVSRVHPRGFVEDLLAAVPASGLRHLDGDTSLNPASGQAALRAAGAICAAVDAVLAGEVSNAFCAVRPPGHHAEPEQAMGFCLFNNVAIGALHARTVHNLRRIAVVDFDVHHGNGTQAAFWADPDLFFASTHQWPLYPGTGTTREAGVANNILNMPLAPGSGSREFRLTVENVLLPRLEAFRPDLILISAGFDAHAKDPLANLDLQTEDYGWVTDRLVQAAATLCGGRLVSTLEGGYDLTALAASAAAHVAALMRAS